MNIISGPEQWIEVLSIHIDQQNAQTTVCNAHCYISIYEGKVITLAGIAFTKVNIHGP